MVPCDGTITPAEAAWKRRSAAYPQLSGTPAIAVMNSGKRVWNAVVKRKALRRQNDRAAKPSGPSVAMWIASGRIASRRR